MTQTFTITDSKGVEHAGLSDTSGPHCLCGFIPRSSDYYRARVTLNQHLGRARSSAATPQ